MKNTSNVIAIYSRKSKFTGKGESIGNQVELCRFTNIPLRNFYGCLNRTYGGGARPAKKCTRHYGRLRLHLTPRNF